MKKYIYKSIFAGMLLFISNLAFSQITFTSWIHAPAVTLYASDPTAGIATESGVYLDDIYSSLLPIGFSFTYFDSVYSNCVIGANGNINFTASSAGNFNPWPITDSLLGNSSVYNSICGPWCDMDVVYGGDISYFMTGTAPNRIFGANWCHNGMYTSSICPGQWTTSQILLYESTNNIEVHLSHKSICTAWNAGHAILGIQNQTGTSAIVAPGRDWSPNWSADTESWRFTPDTSTLGYSVSSIPYAPLTYYTIYWYDSSTGGYLGSGDSLVLAYDTVPTTYMALAVGCFDTASTGTDTIARGYMPLMPIHPAGIMMPLTKDFTIYPNPALNQLYVTSSTTISSVEITDITGQEVYNQNMAAQKAEIDTRNFAPGLYFIKINNNTIKKFVKQ